MSIRVLIADDHAVVRNGLTSLLADSDVEIVGEAVTGREAMELVAELKPDVLLMDVRMPEIDGLDALEKIHDAHPDVSVVMLSTYDNPTYVARAVALGALEYLPKGCGRQELVEAVHRAAQGLASENGSLMNRVASSLKKRPIIASQEPALTRREHQVLRHLAFGLSNREIGRSLKISIETVKEHVQNVLRKLGVGDRTEAAVWAIRNKLV